MAAHFWIFPWLALFFGLAAIAVTLLRSPHSGGARLPLPSMIVWALATALAAWLSLRVGAAAGVDYIAARGVLLGSVGALAPAWFASRTARGVSNWVAPAALVVGWGVAITAAARLWLTHGELSGLTGLILGAAISVVILGAAWFDEDSDAGALPVAALAFLATLAAGVQLGFTRAKLIEQMYWPDVPLLLGAALCFGLILAVLMPRPRLRALWIGLPYLLATIAVGQTLAHERTPLKLLGVGALTFALLIAIGRRPQLSRDEGAASGRALLPSLALLVMATAVSYAYWAGYGVALMLLAGWTVAAVAPWRAAPFAAFAPRGLALTEDGIDVPSKPSPNDRIDVSSEPQPDDKTGVVSSSRLDDKPDVISDARTENAASDIAASRTDEEIGVSPVPTPASSVSALPAPAFIVNPLPTLLPAFAFGALTAMHRLLLLQNPDALDVNAVTDAWNFFALSFGLLLPFAAAEAGSARGRVPSWLLGAFWLLALTVPTVGVDYVLGARAGGGLLLGAALAALFSGFGGARRGRVLAGSLTVGALTLIMTPIAVQWDEPTRRVRTLIVIGAVVLLAIAQLRPATSGASAAVEG